MDSTVLLADDSITVQKIVKLSLAEEGVEVVTVSNGEQAIQKLHESRPSLVLADVFMPLKDGYEVCDYIKTHPEFSDLPVILLVHAYEPFDAERAKEVKADAHLTKPFQSINTLVDAVQSLLTQGQSSLASQPVPQAALASQSALAVVAPAQGVAGDYQESSVISPIATVTTLESTESVLSEQPTESQAHSAANFDSAFTFNLASPFTSSPAEEALTTQPQEENNSPTYSEENSMLPLLEERAEPINLEAFTPKADAQYSPVAVSELNGNFDATDEVLDLDDVLTSTPVVNLSEPDLLGEADSLPVLANLTSPVEPVAEPSQSSPVTALPILNLDLGTGQNLGSVAEPVEVSTREPLTVSLEMPIEPAQAEQKQDVGVGTVAVPSAFNGTEVSEALIEQIVNRV
ncbi:MAG TPA: response regulator, partial [Blastocatellia bacterium]|nr:response regulator [Blastocatellia bacterium]